MSQPPYSGPPHPEQPYSGPPAPGQPPYGQPAPGQPQYGQPASGQPHSGEQYPGQPAPGQQYPGQPNPDQQYPGQPHSAQPYSGQPYSGQPYSGQPNPDVPSSVPPQPGLPQPTYGMQPGYPAAEPPKRKSKALPIVLVAVAVVLVLCVGGGTAAFLLVRNSTEGVADAIESAEPLPTVTGAAPTTEPTADPTPTEAARTITVVEPKRLGGRPKLTDEQFARIAEDLEDELSEAPGATTSVGALYGTVAKRDIVVIAGVAAPVDDPGKELTGTFFGAGVGGLDVTGITEVEPGPLGGEAKCGKADASGVNMALCAWADEGSVGWIIWYFKSVKQAKAEFAKLRGEIEKAS